jgi:hypothetical protein
MRNNTKNKNLILVEKLKRIKIPKSNINQLIINSRPDATGFLLLNPARDYIKDITTIQLNNTIRELNNIVEKLLAQKKHDEKKDHNIITLNINNYIMIAAVIVSLIMYWLVYHNVKDFADTYIWIPLSFVLLSLLVVLVFLFYGLFKEREITDYDFEIINALENYAQKINKDYYIKKGYQIDIGEEYAYVTIRKIKKKEIKLDLEENKKTEQN